MHHIKINTAKQVKHKFLHTALDDKFIEPEYRIFFPIYEFNE